MKGMRVNRTRTTQWNLVFTYVGIGVTFVSGIVLVPLYLAYIPADTYGYWLATGNVLAWLSLVDPGFSGIIQQRVATSYGANDRSRVGEYIAIAVILALVFVVLIGGTGFAMGRFLPGILGIVDTSGQAGLLQAFSLAAVGAALSVGSFSLTAGSQGLQGSIGPGLLYTATQVTALLLTVVLLRNGFGVVALGAANLARGLGLFAGGASYLFWRTRHERIVCRPSRRVFREVLGLSGFTFLAKMPGTLAQQMDTLVVARLLGPQSAVVYGLTRRGYDVARMIAERPTVALMPAVAHMAGEGDLVRLRATLMRVAKMTLWLSGLLVAGFMAFNHDFLRLWVGDQFYAGPFVNVLLALGLGLAVLVGACANLGFALGDVKGNSVATLVASLLAIATLWIGARFGGLIGIAAAPLAGGLFVGAVYFPRELARRLRLESLDWVGVMREGLLTAGIAAGCIIVFSRIEPVGWIRFAGWTAACSLSFGGALMILSKAGRNEMLALFRHAGFGAKVPVLAGLEKINRNDQAPKSSIG